MVHSKVVLVDPFGTHPVLLTGSHNLGPKASGTERREPADHPRRAGRGRGLRREHHGDLQPVSMAVSAADAAEEQAVERAQGRRRWQKGYLKPGSIALREIDFWGGE